MRACDIDAADADAYQLEMCKSIKTERWKKKSQSVAGETEGGNKIVFFLV